MKLLRRLLLVATVTFGALSAHADLGGSLPLPTTLRDAERELVELERRMIEIDVKSAEIRGKTSLLEHRILARSRAYTRLVRAGLLPVAGGFDAFVSHAMKIEGARRAILSDLEEVKRLQQDTVELGGARDSISARRAVVAAQRDALNQAQSLLEEAEERRRSFERAFLAPNRDTDRAAIYGASISVRPAALEATFEAAKGRLPLPLAGRAEIRDARKGSGGPTLELITVPGAAVRVVHPGRVAFSGVYADYGRLVLVDHGAGYFTLYGNLEQVDIRTGDDLEGGARLGTVAGTGRDASLFFEVRRRNETVEPRPWLGL